MKTDTKSGISRKQMLLTSICFHTQFVLFFISVTCYFRTSWTIALYNFLRFLTLSYVYLTTRWLIRWKASTESKCDSNVSWFHKQFLVFFSSVMRYFRTPWTIALHNFLMFVTVSFVYLPSKRWWLIRWKASVESKCAITFHASTHNL